MFCFSGMIQSIPEITGFDPPKIKIHQYFSMCCKFMDGHPAQNWCFGKSGQGRATTQDPPGATGGGFTEPDGEGGRIYRVARFSIARPMLMRLSAMTPRPTQRFIPASPL